MYKVDKDVLLWLKHLWKRIRNPHLAFPPSPIVALKSPQHNLGWFNQGQIKPLSFNSAKISKTVKI